MGDMGKGCQVYSNFLGEETCGESFEKGKVKSISLKMARKKNIHSIEMPYRAFIEKKRTEMCYPK